MYLAAFSVGAALWLISVFVPEPARYVLWAVALTIELSAPWVGRHQIAKALIHASHLVERFGLFTLIVLGESVISVAQGAADVDWTAQTVAAALGGFVAVACLWWLYFDRIDDGAIRSVLQGLVWNYTHLAAAGRTGLGGRRRRVRGRRGGHRRAGAVDGRGSRGRDGAVPAGDRGGLAVRQSTGRVPWLRLGGAAMALAIGLAWLLGVPVGLLVALDLLLVVLVAVESAGRLGPSRPPGQPPSRPPERARSESSAWFAAVFHVEQGGCDRRRPARSGAPTTPEAAMRYRVTWNVEVDADDEGQARTAARQFLLENEDEALSKVVALEEGSRPPTSPRSTPAGRPSFVHRPWSPAAGQSSR